MSAQTGDTQYVRRNVFEEWQPQKWCNLRVFYHDLTEVRLHSMPPTQGHQLPFNGSFFTVDLFKLWHSAYNIQSHY